MTWDALLLGLDCSFLMPRGSSQSIPEAFHSGPIKFPSSAPLNLCRNTSNNGWLPCSPCSSKFWINQLYLLSSGWSSFISSAPLNGVKKPWMVQAGSWAESGVLHPPARREPCEVWFWPRYSPHWCFPDLGGSGFAQFPSSFQLSRLLQQVSGSRSSLVFVFSFGNIKSEWWENPVELPHKNLEVWGMVWA